MPKLPAMATRSVIGPGTVTLFLSTPVTTRTESISEVRGRVDLLFTPLVRHSQMLNVTLHTHIAIVYIAAVVTFLALLLSFSTHVTVTLVASLVSFLAALITLIAFAIDIALYAYVKHEMKKLNVGANTITAPGFWLTFAAFILLLLAGCTVCFGRRKDRMSGAGTSYPKTNAGTRRPGFFGRFRGRRTVIVA